MANKKNLGIYWGHHALYCVEIQETTAINLFEIPFEDNIKEILRDGSSSLGGMELKSNIQKVLRKQNLLDASASLSLPAHDIIFRSFVIPWMEPHEVKSVVEFEVSKYIPFSLEKLAFSFHPINFRDKDIKQLRIIFVAIKKNVLSRYMKILENTSLNIYLAEPASCSLIRALNLKLHNLIPKEQTLAIIEKGEVGRITIVDENIPQFVREFHLANVSAPETEAAEGSPPEDAIKRLTGEVRISLDYFNRQNEQLQVSNAILLSESELPEASEALEKNLPISIIPVEDQLIFQDPSKKELGYLNAYGAGISRAIDAPIHFNFSKAKPKTETKPRVSIPRKPINYKRLLKTALICVPLMVGTVVASGIAKQNFNKKIAELNQKLGPFQDADVEMIEKQQEELNDKLTYFKKIRLQSDAASFLLLISQLLPNDTWLKNLDVTYDDSASLNPPGKKNNPTTRRGTPTNIPGLIVAIDGYAYSKDSNQQFQLVNLLLRNLKNDPEFSEFFDNIDLETTKARNLGEYGVTQFRVVCKKYR